MPDTDVDEPRLTTATLWGIANGWDEIHPLVPPWPAEDAEELALYLLDLDPAFTIVRWAEGQWEPVTAEHRPGPGGAPEHRIREGEWRPCLYRRGHVVHPGRG
jgi:hypothetical protein